MPSEVNSEQADYVHASHALRYGGLKETARGMPSDVNSKQADYVHASHALRYRGLKQTMSAWHTLRCGGLKKTMSVARNVPRPERPSLQKSG